MARSQNRVSVKFFAGNIERKAGQDCGGYGKKQLARPDGQHNQYADRKNEIYDISLDLNCARILIFLLQVQFPAFQGIDLSRRFNTVICLFHTAQLGQKAKAKQRHDYNGGDGIECVGNDMVKGFNRVSIAKLRDAVLRKKESGEKDRPGGKGEQRADRRAGGIDHIGERLTGTLCVSVSFFIQVLKVMIFK